MARLQDKQIWEIEKPIRNGFLFWIQFNTNWSRRRKKNTHNTITQINRLKGKQLSLIVERKVNIAQVLFELWIQLIQQFSMRIIKIVFFSISKRTISFDNLRLNHLLLEILSLHYYLFEWNTNSEAKLIRVNK